MSKQVRITLLIGIICVGAFLRFWDLGKSELLFDEGLYSFRSIGYLDYLDSATQTTPVQWLADKPALPLWEHLSFHDHPPLFFLIQHLFFAMFGDSLFVSRLPSAFFGIASIFLAFLIAKKLFKKSKYTNEAGLISAFFLSINFSHLLASRLGMLEGVSMFFIFLNLYFFLCFLEDKKYWFWFGASLGLAFLTKYVAVFLIPAYLIYLLIKRQEVFRDFRIYAAIGVAIIIFSPVIIYNLYSLSTFGHFDLQLASALHQKLPWQGSSGKTQEPFSNLFQNLLIIYSIPFLLILLAGIIATVFWFKKFSRPLLPLLLTISLTALLMFVGSAIRFASLYTISSIFLITIPFLILFEKYQDKKWLPIILLAIFGIYEIYFSLNLLFFNAPNYGVVSLDKYFDATFGNVRPSTTPKSSNPHLESVIKKYSKNYPATIAPTGIIYDDNIALQDFLWLFSRRQYYHGIPIMSASMFLEKLKSGESKIFSGYQLYFVKADKGSPTTLGTLNSSANEIEKNLQIQNLKPDKVIKSGDNLNAYEIYKFNL